MSLPPEAAPVVKTEGRAQAALVLGLVSLIGLVLPFLLVAGLAGIYLGWTGWRRIDASGGELKGGRIALTGLALSVLGTLLSSVLPGLVIYVYVYAAFHGGRLPFA